MKSERTPKERIALDSAIITTRRTIALAKVRCLPFAKVLKLLKKGPEQELFDELIAIAVESHQSPITDLELVKVIHVLRDFSDQCHIRDRDRIDRKIGKLLRCVAADVARPFVIKYLNDRRKPRRTVALSLLRELPVDTELQLMLLGFSDKWADEAFLKAILKSPDWPAAIDPSALLERIAEDYWQMRVIEGALAYNEQAGLRFAHSYPLQFIWASGRLADKRLLPYVVSVFEASDEKIALLDITAWAFGKLQASKELLKLQRLIVRLDKSVQ